MNVLIALALGYFVGAKTGGKELDQLGKSVMALCDTDEFADVVTAARAHVGSTLRELAGMVDGGAHVRDVGGDLLAHVKLLVDRD